jgi:hypothetical protein
MKFDIAGPDLTPLVVAFAILDVIAVLALVGVVVDVAVPFFRRHRQNRQVTSEGLFPYYRRLALRQ